MLLKADSDPQPLTRSLDQIYGMTVCCADVLNKLGIFVTLEHDIIIFMSITYLFHPRRGQNMTSTCIHSFIRRSFLSSQEDHLHPAFQALNLTCCHSHHPHLVHPHLLQCTFLVPLLADVDLRPFLTFG